MFVVADQSIDHSAGTADSTAKNNSVSQITEECLRYVQINGFDVDELDNILTAGKRFSGAGCTETKNDPQNAATSYVSLVNNNGKLCFLLNLYYIIG